jgi:hypothetical protein
MVHGVAPRTGSLSLALVSGGGYSLAVHLRPVTALVLALLATRVAAQVPDEPLVQPAPADTCRQGRISHVFIDNQSIFDTADPDLEPRFRWAYSTANALHVSTKEWVIRRELLFGPGACFDPFMLEETERVLRGYPFLSRVDVFPVPLPDGTYHVIVATRDEWSTRVDVRLDTRDGVRLEGLRLREDNLLGTGQSVGLFWHEREVTRDYGVTYHTPQLVGTRWDLSAALGRTRAGTAVLEEVAYPFVGEVSRWGGRQSFLREDQYFDYVLPRPREQEEEARPHVLVPVREQAFDVALVRRLGRRGNTALVGAALTYQQLTYPGVTQVSPAGDFDERYPAPDSVAELVRRQRQELHNIRAFALLGQRNVWWVRRYGLDSMRGQEDVRLGAEAILGVGRSMPTLEADDDLYGLMTLYAAFEAGDGLVIARARGDARRDLAAAAGATEWKDVFVESEVLGYLQPSRLRRHTLVFRAAGTGGWHTRRPYQLTLGGENGLRGHHREQFPGGRRLVLSLEDRVFVGWPLPSVLDVGATAFAEAGRMWAGDGPFGADSGWQASAGVGLRGSFPAGSRTIYRLDFAWPLARGAGAGDFRVTVSVGEFRGLHSREPDRQLVRSRSLDVGGELFRFRQ